MFVFIKRIFWDTSEHNQHYIIKIFGDIIFFYDIKKKKTLNNCLIIIILLLWLWFPVYFESVTDI